MQILPFCKFFESFDIFSNLFVEKRHADQLARVNLDDESRSEVIYRILKDQLKRVKTDLLDMKKEKE